MSQIPAASHAGDLPQSQLLCASCIAWWSMLCQLTCRPQPDCPAEDTGAASIVEKQGEHQPGHRACCPEMETRNGLGIESRNVLGNCIASVAGRLRALLKGQTWKALLVAEAGSEHLPGCSLYSYQLQD